MQNKFDEKVSSNYKAPSEYRCIENKSTFNKVITLLSNNIMSLKKEIKTLIGTQNRDRNQLSKRLINTTQFEKIFSISKKQQAAMRGLWKNRLPFIQVSENSGIFYDLEKVMEYFEKNSYS